MVSAKTGAVTVGAGIVGDGTVSAGEVANKLQAAKIQTSVIDNSIKCILCNLRMLPFVVMNCELLLLLILP